MAIRPSLPVWLGVWLGACLAVAAPAACRRADPAPVSPVVPPLSGTYEVSGLSAPVGVTRDRWGVPHIRAATRDDLFFAQGFVQATDRLFQMDLWRRAAQGRLAEVLGANFVGRDAMTRRIQYRGPLDDEWASYGPEARAIASAFVRGVNAWVAVARERPPEAFVLAGWQPEFWSPEDLLNRTDAFVASGDALAEVLRARLVTLVGAERAAALLEADRPGPSELDPALITFQIGDSLRQIGTRPFFTALSAPVGAGVPSADGGSNAWAIAGGRSVTGSPILASDPHRLLSNPSPRYVVHLTAPGWNVIGATAPWLPGVAIGHNDRVAWGMTSFDADTADLYVERLNPENPHQVEFEGRWRNTIVVRDSLLVKGREEPIRFQREYTPHGVVIGVDRERRLAFTLRWSGMEPGAAGELGALALNRAGSAAGVREALARWKMPPVEVVYAERDGGIGSQVAALVPVRRGSDGRLPAAGWTGRADWGGWQALDDLPRTADPRSGYVASANRNRARTERLNAVLGAAGGPLSVEHSAALQRDVVAWNAERLVPLFARLGSDEGNVDRARRQLLEWNGRVDEDSSEAALYVAWERLATRLLVELRVPSSLVDQFVARAGGVLVPALTAPSNVWFDGDRRAVIAARDQLMLRALAAVVDGGPPGAGAEGRRQIVFAHPLAVTEAARRRFNVGPFVQPGYADTVMSLAGASPESAVGGAFRAVFDTADWDRSIVQHAPGQSETPGQVHFADLAGPWARGEYFPLVFTDPAVAASVESILTLVPVQPPLPGDRRR